MRNDSATDFETYREIMNELLEPIIGEDLDADTLKRLYESKLVYLENLRLKCFLELNNDEDDGYFTTEDYKLILDARNETHGHLRKLIICALSDNLDRISG